MNMKKRSVKASIVGNRHRHFAGLAVLALCNCCKQVLQVEGWCFKGAVGSFH